MLRRVMVSLVKATSVLAMAVTVLNINSLCFFSGHQPKPPVEAMRLKKND